MKDPEILTAQNGRRATTTTPAKTNPIDEKTRKNYRRGLRGSKRK